MKMVGKTHKVSKGSCGYGRKCCAPYSTKRQSKHSAKRSERQVWMKEV